jgi:WD40 repeat protein
LSIDADASGETPMPVSPVGHYHPTGWSADRQWLLASTQTTFDIVKIPMVESGEPQPFVTALMTGVSGAAMSPNGRWLAYTSRSTGKTEVWVQSFPGPGTPTRVSPNGGVDPAWSRNGRELYYIEDNKMMSIAVNAGAAFNFKPPEPLFTTDGYLATGQTPTYDVAADGRFLMIRLEPAPAEAAQLMVIVNWPQMVASKMSIR